MAFGQEYADHYAHFIAGGRTLDIIKQYEADKKNPQPLKDALAKEYGAVSMSGGKYSALFTFTEETKHPALILFDTKEKDGKTSYRYEANEETAEGKALLEKLANIPDLELGYSLFAKRLTGQEDIKTNPDRLREPNYGGSGPYSEDYSTTAAIYRQYGDTYVVSVPRRIRGVFNEASEKESKEKGYKIAAGYRYEWFTPPDSTPVPYSKVVELREKTLGDQLAPRRVPGSLAILPNRKK